MGGWCSRRLVSEREFKCAMGLSMRSDRMSVVSSALAASG